jgi:hypothetical protein
VREHRLQGFEIAVNVADDRALHRSTDPRFKLSRSRGTSSAGRDSRRSTNHTAKGPTSGAHLSRAPLYPKAFLP